MRLRGLLIATCLAAASCGRVPATDGAQDATPAVPATAAPSAVPAGGALQSQVRQLAVAPEHARTGYQRELFEHWVDGDGDGCDTRGEVLERESLTPSRCKGPGRWVSLYDGYATTDPGDLEVDHVVALAEAWDSGAWAWTPSQRRAYANDLQGATLRAVTGSENQRKSDKDPAQWQPVSRDAWCQFAADWVSVKLRYHLTADQAEVSALSNMVRGCPATVPGAGAVQGASTEPATEAPGAPAGAAAGGAGGAPGPRYASCTEARGQGAGPFRPGDPDYLPSRDGDGDGLACE